MGQDVARTTGGVSDALSLVQADLWRDRGAVQIAQGDGQWLRGRAGIVRVRWVFWKRR